MPPQQCANPLFLKWLEELRDAAREKGLKVADVYNKGCRAIAACPVPYTRPVELAQLQGIGPKTVKLLDDKLKAHCAATGEPYPASPPRPPPKRTNKGKGKGKEKEKDTGEEDATDSQGSPAPKKRKSTRAPRRYIPNPRSGPAGILIGMIVAAADEPDEARMTYLTRGEIVRFAQPFCDSSYDHSERGTWVTAWNGMKTLVNKGYVLVQGLPHRYCLTEEGFDMAAALRNVTDEYKNEPEIIPLCRRKEGDGPFGPPRNGAGPGPSTMAQATARPSTVTMAATRVNTVASSRRVSSGRFEFWYLDARGKRVEDLQSARTRLDPSEYVTLRQIEFPEVQRDHPIVQQLRLVDEDPTLQDSGVATFCAYFVEDDAPPKCSKFDERELLSRLSRPAVEPARSTATTPLSTHTTALSRTGSSRPRLSAQLPLPGEHRDSPDFQPSDAIVFPEGSYEIVLILDTREVESRANRDRISDCLERKGVKVETRALRLGDMCWVARRLDAYGAEEDECVLDFVVERKRLDDLCASIRDGRYSEQCFRLGQSGIGNIFYIVEDYQKAQRMQYHGKQIMTAKSQLQVINGFYLKETKKLSDTIDYLVTMTKVIKSMAKDLHIIPSRFLQRTTYAALQTKLREAHKDKVFLTSYEAYQALNKKSNLRTVQEYLARMLLRVKGMSPERVSAMLDVWQTPRALYEAMKARHAQGIIVDGRKKRGPELMFADMINGVGRRKIGDALSKKLWRALWGESAPAQGHPAEASTSTVARAKKAAAPSKQRTRPPAVETTASTTTLAATSASTSTIATASASTSAAASTSASALPPVSASTSITVPRTPSPSPVPAPRPRAIPPLPVSPIFVPPPFPVSPPRRVSVSPTPRITGHTARGTKSSPLLLPDLDSSDSEPDFIILD